jgi:hypothetical protein
MTRDVCEAWPDLDDLGYEFWREAQLEYAPEPGQRRGCGTTAAYQRHRRRHEPACAECTAANTATSAAKRAALHQTAWGTP